MAYVRVTFENPTTFDIYTIHGWLDSVSNVLCTNLLNIAHVAAVAICCELFERVSPWTLPCLSLLTHDEITTLIFRESTSHVSFHVDALHTHYAHVRSLLNSGSCLFSEVEIPDMKI